MKCQTEVDPEFEMLAVNLAAFFEATQTQPNVNDVTSQSAHVPNVENAYVPNAQDAHDSGISDSKSDYILFAPVIQLVKLLLRHIAQI